MQEYQERTFPAGRISRTRSCSRNDSGVYQVYQDLWVRGRMRLERQMTEGVCKLLGEFGFYYRCHEKPLWLKAEGWSVPV